MQNGEAPKSTLMGALGAVAGELIFVRKLKIRVTRVFLAALFNGFVKRFFSLPPNPTGSTAFFVRRRVFLLNYQKIPISPSRIYGYIIFYPSYGRFTVFIFYSFFPPYILRVYVTIAVDWSFECFENIVSKLLFETKIRMYFGFCDSRLEF